MGSASIIPNFLANKIALEIIGGTAVMQLVFTQIFNKFFNTVPLSVGMWIKVIGLAACIIVIDEVVKFVLRLASRNANDEEGVKVNA